MFYHCILAYQLFCFQAYAEMFYNAMVEDADYKLNGEEFCDQAWVKGCIAEIEDDEQSHSDNRENKSYPQLSFLAIHLINCPPVSISCDHTTFKVVNLINQQTKLVFNSFLTPTF